MDNTTLFMLLFLFLLGRDPNARETLASFLGFYRENRDLVASLVKEKVPPAGEQRDCSDAGDPQKNRPEKEGGNLNILEELLKRCAL